MEGTALENTVLQMQQITKYIFDSEGKALRNTDVKILEDIDFNLKKGEVHALIGENGAGKSTLMKVLGGIIPPDKGQVIVNGKQVDFANPMDAKNMGIAFIHQELNLCMNLDVGHNMFLGNEITNKVFMNKKEMYKRSSELLKRVGFDISPKEIVRNLSTAQCQLVEIAKALSYQSQILIMDEPTASLSQNEISILFNLIHEMKKNGISIIYITHRLEELLEIGDRITVLRDGKNTGYMNVKDFDYDKLINMMVGRTLKSLHVCNHTPQDDEILRVENLKISERTEPLNLNIKAGEIVGIGGLVGSGRTELAQSIFGVRKFTEGQIIYKGENINNHSPKKNVENGIAYVSEDRKNDGLILQTNIKKNITLTYLKRFFKHFLISNKQEKNIANTQVKRLNIVCRSIEQTVNTLSGGNQQKICLAKWLTQTPNLLILDEPTRGIDINAKAEIYKTMDEIASMGVAILMISSEMPELIGMSDRIYVMRSGTISAEISKEEFSQERILASTLN